MTGRWRWIRLGAGAAVLGVIAWRLGAGPFLTGIRSLGPGVLAAAVAIGIATTACCAARWRVVARGLGVDIPFGRAVAAYYRSLLLNTVLPGGVVGDLERGISHGREVDSVGLGLRSVGWERAAGQVVQIAVTALALLVLPSPERGAVPWLLLGLFTVVAAVIAVLGSRHDATSRGSAIRRAVARDLRAGVLDRRTAPVITLTSVAVVAGHVGTFLLAARAVGVTASTADLLGAALLVLAASAIPANIGGWGPREGAAAWVFAAAGWGAGQGVAVATAYGVMALVASLPGAAVMLAGAHAARREEVVNA